MKRILEINGKKYISEGAKKTADAIKSYSKYDEKGVYPLSKMLSSIKPMLKKGPGVAELKKRLQNKVVLQQAFYVQTGEMNGFAVFNDDAIFELVGDEGGDAYVAKSKNWKKDIKDH
tara:strand:- start:214 stop:564 length:351 start_codon:yes stop_codon:yes gene_type:complete